MRSLPCSKKNVVLQQGLGYLIQSSWYMNPSAVESPPELENFIFNLFKKAKPENPMQIALYNRFITVARTPETLTQIRQWLNKQEAVPGVRMDQERR